VLVTFKSPASANITMFGEIAVTLLKLMGMSGSVPGALRPEDIPPALERLKQGLAGDRKPGADLAPDEDGNAKVSLANRAFPLIDLLSAAAKKSEPVLWE
jgi:Domain of unknown function (DUF1840)